MFMAARKAGLKTQECQHNLSGIYIGNNKNSMNNLAWVKAGPDFAAQATEPNKAFFHWNPKLLGLGKQIGQINSGAFEVFSAKLSAPFLS